MKIERYSLKAENDLTIFEFISERLKGLIQKIIQFQKTDRPNLYNLAFGGKNTETGEIDDLVVSNNGDSEKVLATVAAALFVFFDKYPMRLSTQLVAPTRVQGYTELALPDFTMR
jgi:hypothetical protein